MLLPPPGRLSGVSGSRGLRGSLRRAANSPWHNILTTTRVRQDIISTNGGQRQAKTRQDKTDRDGASQGAQRRSLLLLLPSPPDGQGGPGPAAGIAVPGGGGGGRRLSQPPPLHGVCLRRHLRPSPGADRAGGTGGGGLRLPPPPLRPPCRPRPRPRPVRGTAGRGAAAAARRAQEGWEDDAGGSGPRRGQRHDRPVAVPGHRGRPGRGGGQGPVPQGGRGGVPSRRARQEGGGGGGR